VNRPLPQIGRYSTLGVIGTGGMGTVYLARHPELGFELAIKVLLSGKGASEAQRKRFYREVRALGQLNHPGLVEVVEAGEQDGVPWFAMRRVAGESLEERLRRGDPLSAEAVVALGVQLCESLSAAHAIGILHRDLKPDNVLLNAERRYVVTDFGLAKELNRDESVRLTQADQLQGTPGYWAPEQAAGRGAEATTSVDVYGVGAVLYAALTGLPPIQGESLLEVVVATQERRPTSPSGFVTISAGLERVVMRCLEKSPADRFESLAALCAALRDLESQDPSGNAGGSPRLLAWGALILGLVLVSGAVAWTPGGKVDLPATPSPAHSPLGPTSSLKVSPSPLSERPAWYRALPAGERAPLPLPAGLEFGVNPREYVNRKDGSVLVWVWPGSFSMGSLAGKEDEKPVRVVTFAEGYFLGRYETTWLQYLAFCDATGRRKPSRQIEWRDVGGSAFVGGGEHPVFNVSWLDAVAYCRWAGLRLPSEAEWEYGARGPKSTAWPWGEAEPNGTLLNAGGEGGRGDGFKYIAPRGSFPSGASLFGCMDLAGNVYEWVQDTYVPTYQGAPVDGSARESTARPHRVFRGGGWFYAPSFCRSASRSRSLPTDALNGLGFRPARSP
jgi:eukaryotic-like serine/threonine-protein kinase